TRKLLSVVLICSLMITILAACGGNNDNSSNNASTNTNVSGNTNTNSGSDASSETPAEDTNQYGDTGGLTLPLVDKPTKITWMLVGESDVNDKLVKQEILK